MCSQIPEAFCMYIQGFRDKTVHKTLEPSLFLLRVLYFYDGQVPRELKH